MPIEFLRTPDDRFSGLADWPYAPRYLEDLPGYEGLRLAYTDEGPRDGAVVLCLHGQPTWSYLYRKMIPVFVEAGHRVLALDWFGFGRSDNASIVPWWKSHEHGPGDRSHPGRGLHAVAVVCEAQPGLRRRRADASFWSTKWSGRTFMAVGVQDPMLGAKPMAMMRTMIRGCPEPLMLEEQGHFVQESGDVVARAALEAFAVGDDVVGA